MTHEAIESRKNGIFSANNREIVKVLNRLNGQKSSNRKRNGSVTSIGFLTKTRTKTKKTLNTSFRSEIQATDSTRKGCHANNAAQIALIHSAPVKRRSPRKASTA